MKIIYEVGDLVTLEDNVEVPYELGATKVELLEKLPGNKWRVLVDDILCHSNGQKFVIGEEWIAY